TLGRPGTRRRTAKQIADELARWERVLGEAKVRLVRAHDAAPHVDPADLAEASRLRNEWRYSVHVDAWERRRRTRREAQPGPGRSPSSMTRRTSGRSSSIACSTRLPPKRAAARSTALSHTPGGVRSCLSPRSTRSHGGQHTARRRTSRFGSTLRAFRALTDR